MHLRRRFMIKTATDVIRLRLVLVLLNVLVMALWCAIRCTSDRYLMMVLKALVARSGGVFGIAIGRQ